MLNRKLTTKIPSNDSRPDREKPELEIIPTATKNEERVHNDENIKIAPKTNKAPALIAVAALGISLFAYFGLPTEMESPLSPKWQQKLQIVSTNTVEIEQRISQIQQSISNELTEKFSVIEREFTQQLNQLQEASNDVVSDISDIKNSLLDEQAAAMQANAVISTLTQQVTLLNTALQDQNARLDKHNSKFTSINSWITLSDTNYQRLNVKVDGLIKAPKQIGAKKTINLGQTTAGSKSTVNSAFPMNIIGLDVWNGKAELVVEHNKGLKFLEIGDNLAGWTLTGLDQSQRTAKFESQAGRLHQVALIR